MVELINVKITAVQKDVFKNKLIVDTEYMISQNKPPYGLYAEDLFNELVPENNRIYETYIMFIHAIDRNKYFKVRISKYGTAYDIDYVR